MQDPPKWWLVGDRVGGTAILIALLTLTFLPETSSTKRLAAKVMAVFIDIMKPRLTVSVCHRLAPIEGQKENKNLEKQEVK